MERPCVRVPREAGEQTRQELESAGVRDQDYSIESTDDYVFIPITDRTAVPASMTVVDRDLKQREGQSLPEDFLDFSPTYERLGELILLQESDPERAAAAADAFMDSDLPVKAVLNRASAVSGDIRVPEWTLLAGDTTETIHREYGVELCVDPTEAYFSPRLATERQRVISQVERGEHVLDMFAGVGPYAIRAAVAGAEVVAVDINQKATEYCVENARRNGVEDRVTVITGDVRSIADAYDNWADRLIMNLPHTAEEFLSTASKVAGDRCRLHYYDIQPTDAPFAPGVEAIESAFSPAYTIEVANKRVVRSYAPGVVNVCLDVDLTRID